MRLAPSLSVLAFLLLSACAPEPSQPADPFDGDAAAPAAPAFVLEGPSGVLTTTDVAGSTVVLLFAEAGDDAWQYLAEAAPDLLAAGALVAGAATDGPTPEGAPFLTYDDPHAQTARRFGYAGAPLLVVLGADGTLRAHSVALRSAGDVLAAAAPSLLEAEPAPRPNELAAGRVDAAQARALVAEGAALVDLRPAEMVRVEGPIAHAVRPATPLAAQALPANLAAPVVIVGPGAMQAAARARSWGYTRVYHLTDASDLADSDAAPLVYPAQKNGRGTSDEGPTMAPGRVRG
ncbi:MAG: hypothetical protein ACK41D_05325 [Rubricoccaceae bacterium]